VSVPEFPLDVLPDVARKYVESGAAALDAPADFIAVPLLSMTAATFGRRWVLQLKRGWKERGILFTATIGEPGTGKSPGLDLARKPVEVIQTTNHKAFSEAKEAYETKLATWQSSDKKTRGAQPQPPRLNHIFTVDATMESLVVIADANPGVCIIRDELTGWVESFDAYRGGRGGDRTNMLSAWAGSLMKVDRKGGEPLYCPHPAISVTGGIQPDLLPTLVRETSRQDGMVDRILLAMPDTHPMNWTEHEVAEETEKAIIKLFSTLYHGDYNEPPKAVLLSAEAKTR
jgi:Protein of unknown function (DUF3987)